MKLKVAGLLSVGVSITALYAVYFCLRNLSIKFIELAIECASILGQALMMNLNITSLKGSIRYQTTMNALHGNLTIPLKKAS